MSLFTDLNEPGVAGVDYGNRVLLVQAFLAFENRHDVFSRNVDGMHDWHLLRKWLFDSVCKQVRRFEFGGHPDFHAQFSKANIARSLPRLLMQLGESRSGIETGVREGKKVVFLGNWKKTAGSNGVCNVFLEDLARDLADDCSILERPHKLAHVKDSLEDLTIYTDILEARWLVALATRKWEKASRCVLSDLAELVGLLECEFDVEIDREALAKRTSYVVTGYYALSKSFCEIFSRWQPECVVEVEHYSVFCLVCNEVLHELGIPVIELQHGQIGPGHIAYNLDAPDCGRYLPDRIAAFGQYWIDECVVPDRDRRMIAVGSIPLERGLKASFDIEKEQVDEHVPFVLVVSQGYDNGAVSSFVCDLARDPRANEYRIVVKLHPSERNSWRVVHPELTEVGTRVEIAETGDIDWYLQRATVVVGISSTVLFEAIAYRKRVFILDTVDSEIAQPLMRSGAAELVKDASEFVGRMSVEVESVSDSLKSYVWHEAALENTERLVRGFLES